MRCTICGGNSCRTHSNTSPLGFCVQALGTVGLTLHSQIMLQYPLSIRGSALKLSSHTCVSVLDVCFMYRVARDDALPEWKDGLRYHVSSSMPFHEAGGGLALNSIVP